MSKRVFEPYVIDRRQKFTHTRLLDAQEKFHNRIHIKDATLLAQREGLDLVCFQLPSSNVLPLCKIIDYGKWQYAQKKNKKSLKNAQVKEKEIRFKYNIEQHDSDHKVKQANQFLESGNTLVISMRLFGREVEFMNLAEEKLDSIIKNIEGEEISRKKSRNNIIIHLVPKKEK